MESYLWWRFALVADAQIVSRLLCIGLMTRSDRKVSFVTYNKVNFRHFHCKEIATNYL